MNILGEWKYVPGFPQHRKQELSAPGSYQAVIRLVKEDMGPIVVEARRGRSPGVADCWQPIFTFQLPRTFDLFFSGPWGYRAQYFLGAENGLAANASLLSALAPTLVGAIDMARTPDLAKINVCASLTAASAKIWIDEAEFPFDDPKPGLAVDRWVEAARHGCELARWGLCAPRSTAVQVKGALIDPYGNETVPARKIRRHFDLYQYGFS